MKNDITKNCPFNQNICDKNCALFINPDSLNETVRNKLASIGVLDKEEGMCSFKNMSLCMSRNLFESSSHPCRT